MTIYQVIYINGYIGGKDRVIGEYTDAVTAKKIASNLRKSLSPGERKYFKCTYVTKKIR